MSLFIFIDNATRILAPERVDYKQQRRKSLIEARENDVRIMREQVTNRMKKWYKLNETIERNAEKVISKKLPAIMQSYENELNSIGEIKIILYPFGKYTCLGMPMYKITMNSLTYEYLQDKLYKNPLLVPIFYRSKGIEVYRRFDDTYEVYPILDEHDNAIYTELVYNAVNDMNVLNNLNLTNFNNTPK
jgi:hypothetical protein